MPTRSSSPGSGERGAERLAADAAGLARAVALLQAGRLVAFPTETVYGLGGDARSAAAVRRIFDAKRRPADNPLIVHVADLDAVAGVAASLPEVAAAAFARFAPGPLTLILARGPAIPPVTTGGLDHVGVRIPDHAVAQSLLRAFDGPLAAPSANLSGRPSPTTAAHVHADLGDRIDAVLDGGPCRVGIESTVARVVDDTFEVLRLGAVTPAMLAEVARVAVHPAALGMSVPGGAPLPSPGLRHRHYAPRMPVRLFDGEDRIDDLRAAAARARSEGLRVGLIVTDDAGLTGPLVHTVGAAGDAAAYAARIYDALRAFEDEPVDLLLVEGLLDDGLGAAVMDRLRRAASG